MGQGKGEVRINAYILNILFSNANFTRGGESVFFSQRRERG